MTHSTDKSYYVNSDILSVLPGNYHNNNFVTHAFFSPGFSTDSFGYSHDYKKGMQPEGAAGPEALHILTRKGTTIFNRFTKRYPAFFFILQKGRMRVYNLIESTKAHRCADIPGALIAQGSWGNRQNGIAGSKRLLKMLLL